MGHNVDGPMKAKEETPRVTHQGELNARRRDSLSGGASLSGGTLLGLGPVSGVEARCAGLTLPNRLSFDMWRKIGVQLVRVSNSSAWWIGDWLVYGETAFAGRYELAIMNTPLDYQTLRNYAWVARKFSLSRRRDKLSFGHHAEVVALVQEEQDTWLSRAERLGWTRNELRRRIRAARQANLQGDKATAEVNVQTLRIKVRADCHERWATAAKQQSCNLEEWIIEALDNTANNVLGVAVK